MVLRHKGKEYLFNSLKGSTTNRGRYSYFRWDFSANNGKEKISGKIETDAANVIGLTYYNPPGGNKTCLNTKIAYAELTLIHKDGTKEELGTANRAAFEILTDDKHHGISILET